MPGFTKEIKSVISELYSYGINLEDIKKIKDMDFDNVYIKGKLSDIYTIFEAFKLRIEEKYITNEEILLKLCENIKNSDIIKNSEFVFDGFTGFTPIQNKVLKLLTEYSKKIDITVTIPLSECEDMGSMGFSKIKEQELFNMSKTMINKIYSINAENNMLINRIKYIESNEGRHRDNKELQFLEKHIFRKRDEVLDKNESVRLLKFTDPTEESDYIINLINTLVKEEGYRYSDIAVITGDAERYGKILETNFKKNNIPFFMDNKRSLLLNPCVIGIRAILEMVDDNYSYESVFRFLKSDIYDMDMEKLDLFENYILEFGIRGFSTYNKEFKKKKGRWTEEKLIIINEIRSDLIDLTSEFTSSIKNKLILVSDVCKNIYQMIEKLDIYSKLMNYRAYFEENKDLSMVKEYEQAYDYIIELLEKMVLLLGGEEISLKEFRQIIESGFSDINVGIIPLYLDAVTVGDIERSRLHDIKVLMVLGCNDGVIPSTKKSSNLLSQKDRGFLKRLNLELSPTERESVFIGKYYLYLNLTKPKDKLILTYSVSTTEGKSLRPAYIINSVRALYGEDMDLSKPYKIKEFANKNTAFSYLSLNFSRKIEDMNELSKELFSLFYKDKEIGDKLKMIVDGGFFSTNPTNLSKAVAKSLYGNDILKSVTRLEKYASCAYAHFLRYGLHLVERNTYELNVSDIGTIYHEIIENVSNHIKENKLDFRTISDELRSEIVDLSIEKTLREENNDILSSSKRNEYLISSIREFSLRTIWAISKHLNAGNYNPKDYEFSFKEGRIDRIDTLDLDNQVYVKIIDYKTGNKEFSMDDVINGLQMQLMYYMGAVIDHEKSIESNREVLPGGAFYFNIKSPYIERLEALNEEEIDSNILKEFKMSGLINSERIPALNMDEALNDEKKASDIIPIKSKDIGLPITKNSMNSKNYNKLIEYVKEKTLKYCDEILEGNIELNPYKKGQLKPCDYCEYKSICNFNEKYSNNKFRKLKTYKPEDVYELLNNEEVRKEEK